METRPHSEKQSRCCRSIMKAVTQWAGEIDDLARQQGVLDEIESLPVIKKDNPHNSTRTVSCFRPVVHHAWK